MGSGWRLAACAVWVYSLVGLVAILIAWPAAWPFALGNVATCLALGAVLWWRSTRTSWRTRLHGLQWLAIAFAAVGPISALVLWLDPAQLQGSPWAAVALQNTLVTLVLALLLWFLGAVARWKWIPQEDADRLKRRDAKAAAAWRAGWVLSWVCLAGIVFLFIGIGAVVASSGSRDWFDRPEQPWALWAFVIGWTAAPLVLLLMVPGRWAPGRSAVPSRARAGASWLSTLIAFGISFGAGIPPTLEVAGDWHDGSCRGAHLDLRAIAGTSHALTLNVTNLTDREVSISKFGIADGQSMPTFVRGVKTLQPRESLALEHVQGGDFKNHSWQIEYYGHDANGNFRPYRMICPAPAIDIADTKPRPDP